MAAQMLGLIGLGVMGRNLALNFADAGFGVAAFDTWAEARNGFAAILDAENPPDIALFDELPAMVGALPTPRTILIMVKAGDPVDAVLGELAPLLVRGDTLIDGGNSHFHDTIRREAALAADGIGFLGLGVSGGEYGARHGPALMAGGSTEAYAQARPMLEAIAARFGSDPCCALLGEGGAGHFIKMVHNGIEYGLMQAIAEAYGLMRDLFRLDHADMSGIFRCWNDTELSSYLIEITGNILEKPDDFGSGPLVEAILDKAGQKGTGRWSSETALALGIPTSTISEAVFARAMASFKDERVAASEILLGPSSAIGIAADDAAIEALRQALLGAFVAIYAQGLSLIEAGGREHGWQIDLAAVAAVWRNGCVIRAALLDDVAKAYSDDGDLSNLMCAPHFAEILARVQDGWRQTVQSAVRAGMPVPGLGSALTYFDGYRQTTSWANLIRAQRDCFGAHGYERLDRPGTFHTEWM